MRINTISVFFDGFVPAPVKAVPEGKDRVTIGHPRAGKAHDGACFFAHRRFIAVDGTLGAGGFSFLEGALGKAGAGIFQQFRAFGAKRAPGIMMLPAIHADHALEGVEFPAHSGMGKFHTICLEQPHLISSVQLG